VPTGHALPAGALPPAAAEMALASSVGLTLDATSHAHAHVLLFCEDQGRYLVATDKPEAIVTAALQAGVSVAPVGLAGGDAFASEGLFAIPLAELRQAHEGWMPAFMGAG
jgi:phosphoribosylformylglycinamidine synthase subunit PurL